MRINWSIRPGPMKGNYLGFSSSNLQLMQALERLGVRFADDAPVHVWYSHPAYFERVPGSLNVLFTMCEGEQLSEHFSEAFSKTDLIVVPSTFCREVFRRYTDRPIHICPLGFDPQVYHYVKHREPGSDERFRWLYVGAPNARKFSTIDDLVDHVLWPMMMAGDVEVYLKTTGTKWREARRHMLQLGLPYEEPEENLLRAPGLVLDNRYLPVEHLAALYRESHAFLSLHMGEGFGIPTLEAMASGLPVIVTDYSGTRDFCRRDNSYPIRAQVGIQLCKPPFEGDPPIETYAAIPDQHEVDRVARWIMRDYRRARLVGKRAAESVSGYTVENSARRLIEILRSTGRAAA